MSTGFIYAIPVLVIVAAVYLIFSRKGNRPPTYTMSESWMHAPILWAATGEVVPGGGHHDDQERGHANAVNVGGGISGRW
ncbi:MAG: hypothetical protein ACOYO2_07865 [Mycobacterium sp.]